MDKKQLYSNDQMFKFFANPKYREQLKQLIADPSVRGKAFEIMHAFFNNIDLSISQNSDIDGVDRNTNPLPVPAVNTYFEFIYGAANNWYIK